MVRINSVVVIAVTLICWLLLLSGTQGHEKEFELPPAPPTIEELTDGKITIGELITKDNVELVKTYLPAGLYDCVKKGMVLGKGEESKRKWTGAGIFLHSRTCRSALVYESPFEDTTRYKKARFKRALSGACLGCTTKVA